MAVNMYTRSGGAKPGVECYLIGPALVLALSPFLGVQDFLTLTIALLTVQLICIAPMDRSMLWHAVMSQKLGPSMMRNASIGYAECLRPGSKSAIDPCLSLNSYSSFVTSIMFAIPVMWLLTFGPAIALVRMFYPERAEGDPKSTLQLFWFLLRRPLAIQGEGPSNGDAFVEFNINKDVVTTDHSKDEPETMAEFYARQFFARFSAQFRHFDRDAPNSKETMPLRGWDSLMGGDLQNEGWEQSFLSNAFQFGRPIPELETTIRTWLLARLQDPRDKLRLQICRGYDPPRYAYSDEPAEVLCDRILVRQDRLEPGKRRAVPEKDGVRFLWNPTGFSFFASHIFFDGANAWKIIGELFENSQHFPCPTVKYARVISEFHIFLGAMLSLWCGLPTRSLECGPDSMLSSSSFDISIDPLLGLKRACGGPFVASIVGVLGSTIFQHLRDAGKEVPSELHVGVLVGFSVEKTSHFNDYGVVPLRIRQPKGTDAAGEICREASAQLRARAVIAESSWLLPNVYDRRKIGFIDVYSCLDFVVSCAPMTGGRHSAPLNFIGTQEPLKLMSTYIYITMPLYCIAQSYDSKVDLTFVSRATDVNVPQLQDSVQGWASRRGDAAAPRVE